MRIRPQISDVFRAPAIIRRLLLSWLAAATIEYSILPIALKDLTVTHGISYMSFPRFLFFLVILFIIFTMWNKDRLERWCMGGTFAVLTIVSLCNTFSWPLLAVCIFILFGLIIYALKGWDNCTVFAEPDNNHQRICKWTVAILAILFFLFVCMWTVFRVLSFSTPTYDFGIFSQMFYSLKESGLPMTTLERDGLLSHFHVHVSPIYYLMLPFYCLFPFPSTLQVLQAAILASAVIPLWLICKEHGLSCFTRVLLCALLLIYPAYSGGTSYDLHENAFLTPTILWLFYGFDKRNTLITVTAGLLTLCIKEDAAVYVAIVALYQLLRGVLYKDKWNVIHGATLTLLAVAWFFFVTGFLSSVGDGVMTYRYKNFMADNDDSLLSVLVAVLICPMKVLVECVDPQKLQFIGYTLLPLAVLPLFTRKYERYLLIIPYILINLMSDYQYQHSIFFQYTFGSTAFLFYLTVVNLADIHLDFKRFALLVTALILSVVCFVDIIIPKAAYYPKKYFQHAEHYHQIENVLSRIPPDASVSATTFYTTYLSQRNILYDVKYADDSHIIGTEYVVLSVTDEAYESTKVLLEYNNYKVFAELENTLVIYKK